MNPAVSNDLPNLPPAYRLVALDTVDSTNSEAMRRAEEGAEDGTLVWARRQTEGRGRRGRSWHCLPGNLFYRGLAVTVFCESATRGLKHRELAPERRLFSFIARTAGRFRHFASSIACADWVGDSYIDPNHMFWSIIREYTGCRIHQLER